MSQLTDKEPEHWHDWGGKHRMPDPRRIPGWSRAMCDTDERAYWDHLDAHESAEKNPQRQSSDPAVVTALFDMIEANEGQNVKMRALIAAYRMERT